MKPSRVVPALVACAVHFAAVPGATAQTCPSESEVAKSAKLVKEAGIQPE